MMTQAFYTGISGLKTYQSSIDVVSDNIANISTTGFRGYNAEFASLFEDLKSTTSSPNPSSIGAGVRLQTTSIDLSRGSYSLSDRSTDMAIEGNGWFGVIGNQGEHLYTRSGDFRFDQNSDLITSDGLYVLGSMGDNIDFTTNTLTEPLSDVPLLNANKQSKLSFPDTLTYSPVVSTYASFTGNLANSDETINISTGLIDSQNNKNNLNLKFTKSVPQVAPGSQWDIVATIKNLDGSITYDTKNAKANFGTNGNLLSTTLTTIDNNGSPISIDLGSAYGGIVSVPSRPESSSSESDGIIGGDLIGYDINRNAEVIATFSNGYQSAVGQIAIYHFQNDAGLERVSGAKFKQSVNSGEPLIYKDENGVNTIGTDVMTSRLENSNVTMERALTELIILQRSYDSNAKSITTADEMMQKALSMDA